MLSSVCRTSAGTLAPSDQATCSRRLVKLSRASVTPGRSFTALSMRAMQPPQAMPSTARSMPSVPSPAGVANSERSRTSPIMSPETDTALRAEHSLVAAIKIDDQIPLPRLRRRCSMKHASSERTDRNNVIEPFVGRMREPCIGAQTGERGAAGVTRRHVEHGLPGAVACELAADLPMQRVLAFDHRDFTLELQAGFVGARGLDAAEGRNRGAHQHAVDREDDKKESDQPEQHGAAGQNADLFLLGVWSGLHRLGYLMARRSGRAFRRSLRNPRRSA